MDTTTGKRTYIGWTTGDGRRAVAVLDGSVMSPLRPGRPSTLSWGRTAPGAHALAQAILADVFGADAPAALLEPFVVEVVSRLPEPEFELSAAAVLAWASTRRVLQPA